MANIIISAFTCVTGTKQVCNDSFTQEFINALLESGNNVLNIRCNEFKKDLKSLKKRSDINYHKVRKKIESFNPDLIITFNNAFINGDILKYTTCPVACFSADSPAYFNYPELIKEYQDRYYFFHFSPDIQSIIKDWFPFVKDDRNILFGIATSFSRIEKNQDININFVGSMAVWDKTFLRYFQNLFTFNNIAAQSNLQYKYDIEKIKNEFFLQIDEFKNNPLAQVSTNFPNFDNAKFNLSLIYLLTSHMRQEICHSLSDLGLQIFTVTLCFEEFILYGFDIFKCLNTRQIYLLEDLADVYNRSKISLNMPNIQAVNGFSWRVYNILASQSVLLTNKTQYLQELLKGYTDLPMYESAAEAREIALKFLKDDIYRNDISLACNKFVEEKCQFRDKIELLSQVLGINLICDDEGLFENLDYLEYFYLPKFLVEYHRRNGKLKRLKALKMKEYSRINPNL